MGFDNTQQYPNRKDIRKPYRKAGACDRTCRPGGGCPYCTNNRLIGDKKLAIKAKDAMADIKEAVGRVLHEGAQVITQQQARQKLYDAENALVFLRNDLDTECDRIADAEGDKSIRLRQAKQLQKIVDGIDDIVHMCSAARQRLTW